MILSRNFSIKPLIVKLSFINFFVEFIGFFEFFESNIQCFLPNIYNLPHLLFYSNFTPRFVQCINFRLLFWSVRTSCWIHHVLVDRRVSSAIEWLLVENKSQIQSNYHLVIDPHTIHHSSHQDNSTGPGELARTLDHLSIDCWKVYQEIHWNYIAI